MKETTCPIGQFHELVQCEEPWHERDATLADGLFGRFRHCYSSLMRQKPERLNGETLALQALAFLVEDDERLTRFLGLTGMELGSLRRVATDQAALGAILDYFLNWEPLLLELATALELPPEAILRARHDLPGAPTW